MAATHHTKFQTLSQQWSGWLSFFRCDSQRAVRLLRASHASIFPLLFTENSLQGSQQRLCPSWCGSQVKTQMKWTWMWQNAPRLEAFAEPLTISNSWNQTESVVPREEQATETGVTFEGQRLFTAPSSSDLQEEVRDLGDSSVNYMSESIKSNSNAWPPRLSLQRDEDVHQ